MELFQSIVFSKALGQLLSLPKGNKPVRNTIKNCEHPNPRNLFPHTGIFFFVGSPCESNEISQEQIADASVDLVWEIHYIRALDVKLPGPQSYSGGRAKSSARVASS